ncbi:MAG: hypothetical protein ACO3HT_09440, partial [Ilumatobacteraceae bacterium]
VTGDSEVIASMISVEAFEGSASTVPQLLQNFASAGGDTPQLGHVIARSVSFGQISLVFCTCA